MTNTETMKDRYLKYNKLPLPYSAQFDFVIEKYEGTCPSCGDLVSDIKGAISEFSNCVEVRAIGLCKKCNLIIECETMRIYSDGRYMIFNKDTGWVEYQMGHSGMSRGKKLLIVAILSLVSVISAVIFIL